MIKKQLSKFTGCSEKLYYLLDYWYSAIDDFSETNFAYLHCCVLEWQWQPHPLSPGQAQGWQHGQHCLGGEQDAKTLFFSFIMLLLYTEVKRPWLQFLPLSCQLVLNFTKSLELEMKQSVAKKLSKCLNPTKAFDADHNE